MQEIHSRVGGGSGSVFGGGDRRIRAHQQSHQHIQALKCPRCESLNTKFCYYNNYNLSQPRHFCKNCRRYWTKGGVLRNVPVGGGSRKPKRSSKPKHPQPSQTAEPSGNSSSDGSSSVTASNPSAAAASVAQQPSENFPVPDNSGNNSRWYSNSFELMGKTSPDGGMTPVEAGGLTGLGATSSEEMKRLGFEGDLVIRQCPDRKAEVYSDMNGEFGPLDWGGGGGGGDQGLFDLTNGVDGGYWSQSQWTTDYLPLI